MLTNLPFWMAQIIARTLSKVETLLATISKDLLISAIFAFSYTLLVEKLNYFILKTLKTGRFYLIVPRKHSGIFFGISKISVYLKIPVCRKIRCDWKLVLIRRNWIETGIFCISVKYYRSVFSIPNRPGGDRCLWQESDPKKEWRKGHGWRK